MLYLFMETGSAVLHVVWTFPKSFAHARTRAKKLLSSLVAYSLGHTLVKGAVTLTAARNSEGKIQLFQESVRFVCSIHHYAINNRKI